MMETREISKGCIVLGRGKILLLSLVIGSLLGGFSAAAMQNYHYQKEVLPQYMAQIMVQDNKIDEPANKQEQDWTKKGLSQVEIVTLLRRQAIGGAKNSHEMFFLGGGRWLRFW